MDYDEGLEALRILAEARKYVQAAHDKAAAYGKDYMSGALYEVIEETEELLKRIDSIIEANPHH